MKYLYTRFNESNDMDVFVNKYSHSVSIDKYFVTEDYLEAFTQPKKESGKKTKNSKSSAKKKGMYNKKRKAKKGPKKKRQNSGNLPPTQKEKLRKLKSEM